MSDKGLDSVGVVDETGTLVGSLAAAQLRVTNTVTRSSLSLTCVCVLQGLNQEKFPDLFLPVFEFLKNSSVSHP